VAARGRVLLAWSLVVIGLLGVALAERRAEVGASGLSQGPGLIVGVEGVDQLEHRGAPLSVPLDRDRGAAPRACGVALCTLGLLLAARRRPGSPVGARALARWLWVIPGAVGIHRLLRGGDELEGGLGLAAVLLLLSLSLLAAWRD